MRIVNSILPFVALHVIPAMAANNNAKPNIIIIYTDDMGIGDVGFTGGKVSATPNLDKQAAKGKIFTQYYTTAPVSSASRTALTTGMYHIRWNINTYLHTQEHNVNCEQSDFLDPKAPTLAKNLKSVGYKTAHIGKWHLGGGRDVDNAPSITQYGFDSYISTWESPDPDPLLTSTDWIWAPSDSIKRWNRTAYFVDKTIAFLNENKNKPCFINLWPDDVHTPWVYDAESESKTEGHFTLENLRPVIPEFDKQLGRLFNYLETAGLADNTIIVFTSDNGPAPGFEHLRTNTKRGVKNGLYEGGINMPFFITWPAKIKAGQTDANSVIASIDLMPTLSKIGGFVGKTDCELDGEDITKVIFTPKSYQRQKELKWEFGRNKYYNYPTDGDRSLQLATKYKNFKFYTVPDGSKVELYDLKNDPTESKNIAAENPDLVTLLTKQLTDWFRTNDKQLLKKQ